MTISAIKIAHSISEEDIQLVTLQLRYPRFIHAELMTHRVFSRNASSSRAIPVKRLIQDVIDDPVYPSYWGKNKPGMQADEECNELIPWGEKITREQAWDRARDFAIEAAKNFADAGYHKQIVNRLLEPFSHINVIVTATEWDNFFMLRQHPDAQPEIHELADAIHHAIMNTYPDRVKIGEWHLPYIDEEDHNFTFKRSAQFHSKESLLIRLSVARCARVSYLTHEQKRPTHEEDLKLYDRLVKAKPPHMSPTEHQATPDKMIKKQWQHGDLCGNFCKGWIQYRKLLKA